MNIYMYLFAFVKGVSFLSYGVAKPMKEILRIHQLWLFPLKTITLFTDNFRGHG